MPDDAPVMRAVPFGDGIAHGCIPSASRSGLSPAEKRYSCISKSQMSYKRRFRTYRVAMRDIAFVIYPGYSVMALAVATAFEVANMVADEPPYELHFISETGGKVKTSSGMTLESEAFTDMPFDTLVVGGATVPAPSTPGLIAFMSDAPKRHRRIAAVCTGAFVLAEAGLLNGRHATTHWLHARDLQRRFPKVKMDEDRIFVNDGPIWTSAGMTAGHRSRPGAHRERPRARTRKIRCPQAGHLSSPRRRAVAVLDAS